MIPSVITAEDVQVQLQGRQILQAASFTVAKGSITGLIGPSGSGKTTLMRVMVGAQRLSAGRLTVAGYPAGSRELRSRIGYVTQAPAVYNDLTVRQNLAYFAAIMQASPADVERVLADVDMTAQQHQLVGSLSGGQRARVSLAVALVGGADVLILDEPTVGLDPVLRRKLWGLFSQLAATGKTLLISSHVMDEAEQCPQLLVLREGRLLHAGSRQAFLGRLHANSVETAFIAAVQQGAAL